MVVVSPAPIEPARPQDAQLGFRRRTPASRSRRSRSCCRRSCSWARRSWGRSVAIASAALVLRGRPPYGPRRCSPFRCSPSRSACWSPTSSEPTAGRLPDRTSTRSPGARGAGSETTPEASLWGTSRALHDVGESRAGEPGSWVPATPVPGLQRFELSSSSTETPWFAIPPDRRLGLFVAGSGVGGGAIELQWGRRQRGRGRRAPLRRHRRRPAEDPDLAVDLPGRIRASRTASAGGVRPDRRFPVHRSPCPGSRHRPCDL